MAKDKLTYECNQCGYTSSKWLGRCPECGNWNCFDESVEVASTISKKVSITQSGGEKVMTIKEIDVNDEVRFHTGLNELDRVLGGGIVKGSLVLLGGDPGIGKSTLLLQICEYLGQNRSILYVSGEESARQLKLRATRLKVTTESLSILPCTDVERVINTIMQKRPDVVMIDSIQTMSISALQSSPGSITQLRESTNAFMRVAKNEEIPIIIVGHVNKDGAIAGPKVLEHMVDAVLYFEGERNLTYRMLRAVKNRYGSTNEIGVFEMQSHGLAEVQNPSMMLLEGRDVNVSGSCVACIMEGTRPIFAEIQSLVTKTGFGTPRRTSAGFDYSRMNLILAVLEKRTGYFFGTLDVYINVVGGLRLDEPAADLAVAISLFSGLTDKPVADGIVAFGEVGLGGEIRNVTGVAERIKEAERLGFKKAIIPSRAVDALKGVKKSKLEIVAVNDLKAAFKEIN